MIQAYSESNTTYTKNGDITLIPTEAYTECELNGSWTATIVHPIDPEGRWEYLTEQAVVKMPSWNGDQLYRIVQRDKTETEVICTCYPIFYDSMDDCFLVDVRPTGKTGQEALNIMLAPNNKYSGTSNITLTNTAYYEYKNFMEALNGEEDNSFINRWGGEIEFDNFTVNVPLRLGADNGLEMRYGKNIQNIDENIDMSGILTRVYPQGYNGRHHSSYIDSPLINSYPNIKTGSLTFDYIKLAADASADDTSDPDIIICANQTALDAALQAAVEDQFDVGLDKPVVNIEITGVFELSQIAGYESFNQTIELGDTVHLIHNRLGIESDERIIYLKYDSIRERVEDIQIGSHPYDFFREISRTTTEVEEGKYENDPVVAVWVQWCLATSNVIPSGGSFEDIQYTAWQSTVPTYQSPYFYWMRTVTEYASGAIYYSDPIFDMANQVAAEAEIAAQTAQTAAQTAQDLANAAQATADTKKRVFTATPTVPYDIGDLYFDGAHGNTYICTTAKTSSGSYSASDWTLYATDTSNYFWYDSSGAHVSDTQGSVASGNSQTIASGGTVMMRNGKLISSWTGSSASDVAINFYDLSGADSSTAKLIASYGAAGITQYMAGLLAMALTASGMTIYGVDETNQLSITEAVFGKTGVQLYANGVLRLELSATDGLIFYDSDGTTVVGQFNGSQIRLVSSTYEVNLTSSGFIFAKNSTNYAKFSAGSYSDGSTTYTILYMTVPQGMSMTMSSGNAINLLSTGIGLHTTGNLTEEVSGYAKKTAGTYIKESAGSFKTEEITTYKTETIGTNKTETIKGYKSETITGNKTETIGGTKTETVTGNSVETVTGYKTINATGALKLWFDSLVSNGYPGLILRTVTESLTTLNQDLWTGVYNYASGATDAPTSSAHGTLIVLRYSSTYAYQIALPNHSSGTVRIYARLKHSSGSFPSTWTQIV